MQCLLGTTKFHKAVNVISSIADSPNKIKETIFVVEVVTFIYVDA
jgi:hypothetical protein